MSRVALFDDNAKYPRAVLVEPAQGRTFWIVSLVFTIILGISGAIALAVALASDSFVLNLRATTDYRVGTTRDDSFPTAPMLASDGIANLPILGAFVSILGFIAYLVLTLWNRAVVEQMSVSGSPYLWFSMMIWTFLVWVEIAFLAGITNVFLLTFLALASWTWIWLWWASDVINSPFYVSAAMQQNEGGALGWQWLFWAFSAIIGVVVNVTIIIYLVQTFSFSPASPRRIFLVGPIVGILLYLPIPFAVIARYFSWWFGTHYKRDFFLVIYAGIYIFIMTWIPLLVETQNP